MKETETGCWNSWFLRVELEDLDWLCINFLELESKLQISRISWLFKWPPGNSWNSSLVCWQLIQLIHPSSFSLQNRNLSCVNLRNYELFGRKFTINLTSFWVLEYLHTILAWIPENFLVLRTKSYSHQTCKKNSNSLVASSSEVLGCSL